MKIVGIAGTNGSGKDTVGHMLAERRKFLFVAATDLLREEAKKRGLPMEREHLRAIASGWRREQGAGLLIDKAVELFTKDKEIFLGLSIASIRTPGEADRIHELGGKIVWVDAAPKTRYGRINLRSRSSEDQKTFAQFLAEEQAEMSHSGDEATPNMSAVKEKADIFLENNGNDINAFKDEAEKVMKSLE